MSFLPRKGKYLYSGRLSTYKPQNIQVLVRIISCVQPDLFGLPFGRSNVWLYTTDDLWAIPAYLLRKWSYYYFY